MLNFSVYQILLALVKRLFNIPNYHWGILKLLRGKLSFRDVLNVIVKLQLLSILIYFYAYRKGIPIIK